MRLLYVVNARIPTEKAHGLQIIKTIEALEKAGVDVTLFVPKRKNYIKISIETFYNIKHEINVVRVLDLVRPVQYLSERLYFPLQRMWFGFAAFAYALFWPGVIYSRDITISFFLSLFGKRVAYEDHQPKERWRWLYAFFLRTIRRKVVVARHLIAEYKTMRVSKKSYVCAPNGADVAEFDKVSADKTLWNSEFGIPKGMPIVLYVGHFYRWKGVYTLLDAAKDIKATVVLIGGTKEDYEAVMRYVKERVLANVYLHPFVPHHDVIRYIKSANVLVLPNTADEERSQKYTTPIKLFEYMASGVPIVASNVPSFTPYLENNKNAFLCEPDNAEALATAVNYTLQNPDNAKQFAQRAREAANQYTWDSRARIIVKFIK